MSHYRAEGVVLRSFRLGEADRVVVVATAEQGKVRAVAKGVRRTRSRWGGRLEPLTHVAVQCWRGRGELDTVTQAQVLHPYLGIRADLERTAKAFVLLEVADQLVQERHPTPLVASLVGALGVLEAEDPPLLVPAFLLRALALEGAAPQVAACNECGATDQLVAFDGPAGGVRCRAHASGRGLSGEALGLLQAVLGGQLRWALAQPAGPAVAEVAELAGELMEQHLDRRLRSLRTPVRP
ncbi:DNA repair protein RecO [Aciditerrimonas ferrireducens]|jgi:DNA repair protein RecO (recombination protein O)|uniref:DNA repair protein RecO n=1 Tax=Aciditerrimonas ferrireducens TaxID=667306 RepID=UPI002005DAFB|nr:DNA repair protein RecO [Aciditerrimonas ferrireducens]MCK4176490.1 DNA repair protein RecO [Aciditerrimonas ferrireducens]